MARVIELDVLIIGSGAGGGTVASRLAHLCGSGARIAIAEAGPWWGRDAFNMREADSTSPGIEKNPWICPACGSSVM